MDINVYNFNRTIYNGDVTFDFYIFCLKRHPLLIRFIFIQLFTFFLYCIDVVSWTTLTEKLLCFLKAIKNIDLEVEAFWKVNSKKIKGWYKEKENSKDIIISSGPEFLLKPIGELLHVQKIISSKVNITSGRFFGEACNGDEKVNMLSKEISEYTFKEFYSDSFSDTPLALLAIQSFIVDRDKIYSWNNYKLTGMKKLANIFINKDFIVFLMVGVINTFNGVLLAYLYSNFIDANLAFILGYGTSLCISYLLNSKFTFKASLSVGKWIKFCISYIPNFIIQLIVVMIFLNLLSLPELFTYGLAAVIGIPVTFLVLKVYAFAHNK